MFDQFFWGRQVAWLGVGPDPLPFTALSQGTSVDAATLCARVAVTTGRKHLLTSSAPPLTQTVAAKQTQRATRPARPIVQTLHPFELTEPRAQTEPTTTYLHATESNPLLLRAGASASASTQSASSSSGSSGSSEDTSRFANAARALSVLIASERDGCAVAVERLNRYLARFYANAALTNRASSASALAAPAAATSSSSAAASAPAAVSSASSSATIPLSLPPRTRGLQPHIRPPALLTLTPATSSSDSKHSRGSAAKKSTQPFAVYALSREETVFLYDEIFCQRVYFQRGGMSTRSLPHVSLHSGALTIPCLLLCDLIRCSAIGGRRCGAGYRIQYWAVFHLHRKVRMCCTVPLATTTHSLSSYLLVCRNLRKYKVIACEALPPIAKVCVQNLQLHRIPVLPTPALGARSVPSTSAAGSEAKASTSASASATAGTGASGKSGVYVHCVGVSDVASEGQTAPFVYYPNAAGNRYACGAQCEFAYLLA
jgi:hypothetical protein